MHNNDRDIFDIPYFYDLSYEEQCRILAECENIVSELQASKRLRTRAQTLLNRFGDRPSHVLANDLAYGSH